MVYQTMNEAKLSPITNREDYSEPFNVLDENGDEIDLEAAGATAVCYMSLPGTETYTALTVSIEDEIITIGLTSTQTRSLCASKEYDISCHITIDNVVTTLFVGTIPVIHGRSP